MLFKNKKGIELTFTTIIVIIILLFVMTVVLLFFGKFFGLEVGILTPTITGLQCDSDEDGINNAIDTCPCDPNTEHQPPNCNPKTCDLEKNCKNQNQASSKDSQQAAQSKK